jgi:hypothetical protein
MMRDESNDSIDTMITQSLDKHFQNSETCKGPYDYLCKSKEVLGSPLVADIIQEIDAKSDELVEKAKEGEIVDPSDVDVKSMIKNVENYERLREKLKEVVSQKVVNDVTRSITQSNDAPTFSAIDDKLAQTSDEAIEESVILCMSSRIIKEHSIGTEQEDLDNALQEAIVEYCVHQLNYAFKQIDHNTSIYARYDLRPKKPKYT